MKLLLLAFALLVSPISFSGASQEEYVQWTSVRVDGHGHEPLGDVSFAADTDNGKISAVHISAFGRDYQLDDEQINQIQPYRLESLRITHEGGYKELGGHTVHFKLSRFTRDDKGEIANYEAVISVPLNADLSLSIRRR